MKSGWEERLQLKSPWIVWLPFARDGGPGYSLGGTLIRRFSTPSCKNEYLDLPSAQLDKKRWFAFFQKHDVLAPIGTFEKVEYPVWQQGCDRGHPAQPSNRPWTFPKHWVQFGKLYKCQKQSCWCVYWLKKQWAAVNAQLFPIWQKWYLTFWCR